jgi:hypothetical protein
VAQLGASKRPKDKDGENPRGPQCLPFDLGPIGAAEECPRKIPAWLESTGETGCITVEVAGDLLRKRESQATGCDQDTSHNYGPGGGLVEFHSGDDLRDEKEQNHINSQQFSKIPSRKINHQTVEGKAQGPRGNGRPPRGTRGTVHSRLEKRVPGNFEERCNEQQGKHTPGNSKPPIERPHASQCTDQYGVVTTASSG